MGFLYICDMLKQTKIGYFVRNLQAVNEIDIWLLSTLDTRVTDFVAELQRRQLEQGTRPDGTFFDDYSEASVNIYGKEPGPIKWKNSGYFYDHIASHTSPDFLQITNEGTIDEITGQRFDLEIRFNEEIIGLDTDSMAELIEKIKERYLQTLRRVLLIGGGNSDV